MNNHTNYNREEIISKLRNKAGEYSVVEDDFRAIKTHILLLKWEYLHSGELLIKMAKDYPQTIFNAAKEAAEEGWSQFNLVLGHCYERGLGTAADIEKAVACYTKYIQKFRDHQLEAFLGVCYYRGMYGLEQDTAKAFHLFERASECKKFSFLLGICYYEGIGCEQNYQKAFELLANHKCKSLAAYYLGKCYFYGRGTDVNYDKAFACFERAACCMNPRLQLFEYYEQTNFYLAQCYRDGLGTECNLKKASRHSQLATRIRRKFSLREIDSNSKGAEAYDDDIEKLHTFRTL